MLISKSNYVSYHQCPKQFYLEKHNKDVSLFSMSLKRRIRMGNDVGLLAKSMFSGIKEVDYGESKAMSKKTKSLIDLKVPYISEAAFYINDLFCAVDILQVQDQGLIIYEVKSSSKIKKDYYKDLAFQTYVIQAAGYKVLDAFVIYVNKNYVREDQIDLNSFFIIESVLEQLDNHLLHVKKDVDKMRAMDEEPEFSPVSHCSNCSFNHYCYQDMPKDSIFILYGFRASKAYHDGMRNFQDLLDNQVSLTIKQKRQIDHFYLDQAMYIDHLSLFDFLNQMIYPLYFLDFETLDFVIPNFKGSKVNQRLPYQASIHYLNQNHSQLIHEDILVLPDQDPRERMIDFLIKNLGVKGHIMVYNQSFEKSIIKDLANQYPQYKKALLDINQRIIDLYDVFKEGMVYMKEFEGSFSIKSVYPALCQSDSYEKLDQVHHGVEAMEGLERLSHLQGEEQGKLIKDLKAYCRLDTLSMVQIYVKLLELING